MSRRSFSAEFKLKVVSRAKVIGNRPTALEFKVDEKCVRMWLKLENRIKQIPMKNKRIGSRKGNWTQLESRLITWVKNLREMGRGVSTTLIRIQGKELAKQMNISDFTASPSWCFRFMKRFKLSIRQRTSTGKPLSLNWKEKLVSFKSNVKAICNLNCIQNHALIANMDELPCTFDLPSSRTVDIKGKRHVNITTTGNEKLHFTIVLSCFANGRKLKPLVIFKGARIPSNLPQAVIAVSNSKGWMNEEVMFTWINNCWTKSMTPSINLRRRLLIMDSMSSHKLLSVKRFLLDNTGTLVSIIPGGLTKLLQPLDLTINHVFKLFLRREWESWMRENIASYSGGSMLKPTVTTICLWISKAWDAVKDTTIQNAFIKADFLPNFDTFVMDPFQLPPSSETFLLPPCNLSPNFGSLTFNEKLDLETLNFNY